MSAQPKLDKVLTMPEVAAIAGWDGQRMRRHLLKMNQEVGGMLLKNIGSAERPRWTVTLAALQRAAPMWFSDPEAVQSRLDALESEVKHLRRVLAATNQAVAALAG